MPRITAVWVLYWAGHATSLLLDAIAHDWPHDAPDWLITVLYRVYGRLMGWSADLDIGEAVWMNRREGETEEAFESRVCARWPDED